MSADFVRCSVDDRWPVLWALAALGFVSMLGVTSSWLVAASSGCLLGLVVSPFVTPKFVYRGAARLRAATADLRSLEVEAGPATTAAIVAVARSRWCGVPVRCDAAGHLALIHLSRGDLAAALGALRRRLPDDEARVRSRTEATGHFGEAVRSLLGRLFPETGLEVVLASKLSQPPNPGPGQELLALLVGALHLLETARRGRPSAIERAWIEYDHPRLAAHHPVLAALVHGAVAQVTPTLVASFRVRVRELGSATALVRGRFAALSPGPGEGYRAAAPTPGTQLALGLAPVPPAVANLRPTRSRWDLPAKLYGAARWSGLWLLVPALVMGTAVSLAVLGVMCAVILFVVVGRGISIRDRLRALRKAGLDAPARVPEFRRMRPRNGTLHLDRGELMVLAGLAWSETALHTDAPACAREQIGWWLGGLDDAALETLDLGPMGSSALRVATLLGFEDAARRLSEALRPNPSVRFPVPSGYGDASQAVALAQALFHAVGQRFEQAVPWLDLAARSQDVALEQPERELYGELLRRVEAQGIRVSQRLRIHINARARSPWIDTLWPDVAGVSHR